MSTTELILQNGHVIDPLHGHDGIMDVAIGDGKIVAVGPKLSTEGVPQVLDMTGLYVTPGIIDMHVHAFSWHQRSDLSLAPHENTFSAGVTTIVDASTAGGEELEEFRVKNLEQPPIPVSSNVRI